MVYEIFDKSPNVTNMLNCLITRKPLNLDVEIILSLNIGNILFAIKWTNI